MVFCGACGRLDGVCGACGRLDGVLWSLWQAHVVESCLVPELGPLPAAPALKSNSFLSNSKQKKIGQKKKKSLLLIYTGTGLRSRRESKIVLPPACLDGLSTFC